MSSCAICGKEEGNLQLFEGVYAGKINKVCYNCSIEEKITLIKRPTREQLDEANRRQSVRELMDKLSSPQKKIMTKEGAIAHKNLSKLKFPGMKQEHIDLLPNYDWTIKQARRHRKISVAQLSELSNVEKAKIESLEGGQLYMNFQEDAIKLEKTLGIKLLRYKENKGVILTPQEKESQIIEEVKVKAEKVGFFSRLFGKNPKKAEKAEIDEEKNDVMQEIDEEESEDQKQESIVEEDKTHETKYGKVDVENVRYSKENQINSRHEKLHEDIKEERIDFSKRKDLDKITLADLAELKRKQNSGK